MVRVFPVCPETDLVKLKKNFSGRINYYYTQKKKIIKTEAEKEKFSDSESSLGELFSNADNLGRESLSPAAGPCSSSRKETSLREQIRLLREELYEQLSHYQKKAAAWKGVTTKNKNDAAHSHATGEESSISCSDLKKYGAGLILRACIMEVSFLLQNLIRLVWTQRFLPATWTTALHLPSSFCFSYQAIHSPKLLKEISNCMRLRF